MLQCIANDLFSALVCCSVLQSVAECFSVLSVRESCADSTLFSQKRK